MYIYLRSLNSLHSILTSVLCKNLNNIDSNSILFHSSTVVISIQVSLYYLLGNFRETTWYGSANRSGCARNIRNDE